LDHVAKSNLSVRAITADFGFSFALPTIAPAFPEQPIVEHPTKRQRTVESQSPKPCKKHTPTRLEGAHSPNGQTEKKKNAEDVVAQVEELPAQNVPRKIEAILIESSTTARPIKDPKGSKAPSKTRRKPRLDDELEALPKPKKNASPSGGLEDTFIFGLKPKRKQAKSKSKETIEEEPTHEHIEDVPAPTKSKRTVKAKQQANDGPYERAAGEPNEEAVTLKGNSHKGKGKHTSRKRTDPLPTDIESSKPDPLPTTTETDSIKAKILESLGVETKLSQTASKAAKPKARTKKANKRNLEEVMDNETFTAPEPTAKRPKRQAAVSAIAKVALGYEEELVPADKLRRAPEPVAKRGRPKKIIAVEDVPVLPPSPLQSTLKPPAEDMRDREEDEVPAAKARPVGRPRKLGPKIAKVDIAATEKEAVATSSRPKVNTTALEHLHGAAETETPVLKAPPAKRARKVRAQVVAQDVSSDEPATTDRPLNTQETCEVEQKRSRTPKALPKTSRKAASKAAKLVEIVNENIAVIADVSEPPNVVIPETQESHDTINMPDSLSGNQTKRSRSGTTGEHRTKIRRALADTDVNIARCPPPDDLEVTIKPTNAKKHQLDEAATKPASKANDARKKQSSRKTKLVPAINPTVEHEDNDDVTDPAPVSTVDIVPTKRTRKVQPAQESKSTPTVESPHDGPVIPKRRHVVSADEDLDWLFEKSENKRSRVPARNPCASSKVNRQAPVKKSADAKDMDLDDLLESIAGFSGKLLTGKSGRAMASR
jgi:hypothetical protein